MVQNPPANAGEAGSISGSGRSSGEGHGNPLQYSCLENPMDKRACQATVHQVIKSQTWQSYLTCTVLVCLTRLSLPPFLRNAGKKKGTSHGAFSETPAPSDPLPTYFVMLCVCLVAQLCPTLCNPMDCSPPGSSVHGILQARILEWVAMPFSIFPTQGSNLCLLHLLPWQVGSLLLPPPGKPILYF